MGSSVETILRSIRSRDSRHAVPRGETFAAAGLEALRVLGVRDRFLAAAHRPWARVPVHDPADVGQRPVRHHRSVLVLDAIEQPHNVAAPDSTDRLRPDPRIDEPLEYDAAPGGGAKLFALPGKICLRNRFERVLS